MRSNQLQTDQSTLNRLVAGSIPYEEGRELWPPHRPRLVACLKLDVQPGDIADDSVAAGIFGLKGVELVAKTVDLVADLLFGLSLQPRKK